MRASDNDLVIFRLDAVKRAMLSMQRHSWEQGVAAQALLELGDGAEVVLMAREAVLRQQADGRLGVMGANQAVTDPAANGEPVLWAAQETGDRDLHAAAERMLDYLMHQAPRTSQGTLHHVDHELQVWIDYMYIAPPFLAVAGNPSEAVRQTEGMRQLLWRLAKQLFAHIWDDGRQQFVRQACWGVGNGWAAAGMTRVIRTLPKAMGEEKARLIRYVKDVVDGCLVHRRADGLFHDVVDDPGSFVETNLGQMLAYTIYRGAAGGWLDGAYVAEAERLRAAVESKVDEDGFLGDVCGAPQFDRPGTATEGHALYLLMQAARRDYQAAIDGAADE